MSTEEELALLTAGAEVVKQVFALIEQAKSGKVAPQQALDGITALRQQLATTDAAVDAAAAAKFAGG